MKDITRRELLASAMAGILLAGCASTTGQGGTETGGEPEAEPADSHEDKDGYAKTTGLPGGNDELHLVATQAESVRGNTAWCPSMQLCWDSLMDGMNAGKPVLFDDPARNTAEVTHLNDMLFVPADLSEDHYCSYAGPMTNDAKESIEHELDTRLGQKSEILDRLDGWTDDPKTALLLVYAMIYRKFAFHEPFGNEEGRGFGGVLRDDNVAKDVSYFVAESDTQRNQISPLYYDDADSHAVSIETKEGDEVILVKNPQGGTLDDIWQNAMSRAEKATRDELAGLEADEVFKCPVLDIDIERMYEEWIGGSITLTDRKGNGSKHVVSQAIQTLRLRLDNEGGEVKSEAAITAIKSAAPTPMEEQPRSFAYDDVFALFVRDTNASSTTYPYVGILVSDVTEFQDGATRG